MFVFVNRQKPSHDNVTLNLSNIRKRGTSVVSRTVRSRRAISNLFRPEILLVDS